MTVCTSTCCHCATCSFCLVFLCHPFLRILLFALITLQKKVRLKLGEAYFDCTEEYATEFCERRQAKFSVELASLTSEEAAIMDRQKDLKAALYGRFGKAINLEE